MDTPYIDKTKKKERNLVVFLFKTKNIACTH